MKRCQECSECSVCRVCIVQRVCSLPCPVSLVWIWHVRPDCARCLPPPTRRRHRRPPGAAFAGPPHCAERPPFQASSLKSTDSNQHQHDIRFPTIPPTNLGSKPQQGLHFSKSISANNIGYHLTSNVWKASGVDKLWPSKLLCAAFVSQKRNKIN